MMVALILYSYCEGQRSSRGIERECWEDVAYRVICANLTPDHVTISRFRSEHQDALAGLFGQVLRLCAKAGMVRVGTIAVDGTRGGERVKGADGRLREARADDSRGGRGGRCGGGRAVRR